MGQACVLKQVWCSYHGHGHAEAVAVCLRLLQVISFVVTPFVNTNNARARFTVSGASVEAPVTIEPGGQGVVPVLYVPPAGYRPPCALDDEIDAFRAMGGVGAEGGGGGVGLWTAYAC
jgi:hypothetical protein